MSEITDFYVSWLSGSAFGGSSVRIRDQEPPIFKPTDISGCAIWMDANDNDAVQYNDLLQVTSWANKGTLGGQFDLSGAGVVSYGQVTQNGLNTVTFEPNGFLSGTFNMNFQARSVFYVIKPNTYPIGSPASVFTSDTNGHQETFFQKNGTWLSFDGKHPSPIPEQAFESTTDYTGYAYLTEFIIGTDLSDNWCGYNGTYIPPIYQATASYTTGSAIYYLGNYFGGSAINANIDFCEVIVYEGALSPAEREQVEAYLRFRWKFVEPPPAPFTPTDISGLQLWMDAKNISTLSLSNVSTVTSWSNLGLAGSLFNNDSNEVFYDFPDKAGLSFVRFPDAASLLGTFDFPYWTRTAFLVYTLQSDFTTLTYPYAQFINNSINGSRTIALGYDSNSSNYNLGLFQQGFNAPSIGFLNYVSLNDRTLAIFQCASNTVACNALYYNGDSNINVSSDLGNLFQTNPGSNPYYMGTTNTGSPEFSIAEILEYDSILNMSQLSTVADYLVTKWAISSFVPLV